MLFYKRLVLAFCFPDGAEHTEHLRGEPDPKVNQRARDQGGDRGTAGAKDGFLASGPDGRWSGGRATGEAALQQ